MRPIDADALIRTMRADPLYFVVERYNIEGPIHAAPTIDAIPVSFIEEKMKDIDTVFMKLLDCPEGRDASLKLLREYNALRDLIRAWKEEGQE